MEITIRQAVIILEALMELEELHGSLEPKQLDIVRELQEKFNLV